MKPSESTQIEFIKDCLRDSKKPKSILAEFGVKWRNVSKRTFERRLKQATEAMGAELAQISKRTEESIANEVEARKLKVMPVAERMDLLIKIALGEIKVKKPFVIAGKIMEYPSEPDFTERKNAIAELNKMDGSYAPAKSDITSLGQAITTKATIRLSSGTEIEI